MSSKVEMVIEDYGVSLRKKRERLIIKDKKQVINEVPFYDLAEISILSAGVSISTDLIWECCQRGIPINFLLRNGEPYANLMGPNLTGTVKTRRAQLLAYNDWRSVKLAKAFSIGKLSNQQVLLKYFSKYRKSKDRGLYNDALTVIADIDKCINQILSLPNSKIDEIRSSLMAYEGLGSKHYWSIFGKLLPSEIEFFNRKTRGATDLVNSLLNYGYGILYTKVWGALIRAGLDPFAGFIHVDRSGKPSLVLDFIEEFRQSIVDRTILSSLNKGIKFELDEEGLSINTRKIIADRIHDRLDSTEKYDGHKYKLKNILQKQARHLAVTLREEGEYQPFISGW